MTTSQDLERKLVQHFHSPDEKLIAILGRGFIQSFITGYGISKGLLILTNRRLYQKGKRYTQKPNGSWSSINASAVVDVNDVTGTSFISYTPSGLLWSAIFFELLAFAVSFFIFDANRWEFEYTMCFPWIVPVSLLIAYFLSLTRLFVIEYAGGSIAMDANWFTQSELEEFQKQISLIKGSRASVAISSDQAMTGRPQQQDDPLQILKARLVAGEITPDEFREMKSILEEE